MPSIFYNPFLWKNIEIPFNRQQNRLDENYILRIQEYVEKQIKKRRRYGNRMVTILEYVGRKFPEGCWLEFRPVRELTWKRNLNSLNKIWTTFQKIGSAIWLQGVRKLKNHWFCYATIHNNFDRGNLYFSDFSSYFWKISDPKNDNEIMP